MSKKMTIGIVIGVAVIGIASFILLNKGDTQTNMTQKDSNTSTMKVRIAPFSDFGPASDGIEANETQRAELINALNVLVLELSSSNIVIVRKIFMEMSDQSSQEKINKASDNEIRDGANFLLDISKALLVSISDPQSSLIIEHTASGDSVFLTDGEDPSLKERIFFKSSQDGWKILKLTSIIS